MGSTLELPKQNHNNVTTPGITIDINGKRNLTRYKAHKSGIIMHDTANEPDTYHISSAFSKKVAKTTDIAPETMIPILI